jgi:hypothetical protein
LTASASTMRPTCSSWHTRSSNEFPSLNGGKFRLLLYS